MGGWDELQTGRLVDTTSKATRPQVWIGGSVTRPGRPPGTELRAASGFALAARHLDPRWQRAPGPTLAARPLDPRWQPGPWTHAGSGHLDPRWQRAPGPTLAAAQGQEGQRQPSESLHTATRAPATTGAVVSLSGPVTRQQLRTAPRQAWVGGSQHLLEYLTVHPRVQFQQFLGPGLVEDLGSRQQSASWEDARKRPEAERLWRLSLSNQDRPLQGARRHTAPDTLGTVSPSPVPQPITTAMQMGPVKPLLLLGWGLGCMPPRRRGRRKVWDKRREKGKTGGEKGINSSWSSKQVPRTDAPRRAQLPMGRQRGRHTPGARRAPGLGQGLSHPGPHFPLCE